MVFNTCAQSVTSGEEMEGAKTDTPGVCLQTLPTEDGKAANSALPTDQQMTLTTDWRLKNYNVSSPGEKSEARRNQCLGREKVPAVKLEKELSKP